MSYIIKSWDGNRGGHLLGEILLLLGEILLLITLLHILRDYHKKITMLSYSWQLGRGS